MTHVAIAIIFQIAVGLLCGRWGLAAITASAFFLGREITQAEYRWIAKFGAGHRANMPWWGGFDPAAWDIKSLGDALLPLIVTGAIYLVAVWTAK